MEWCCPSRGNQAQTGATPPQKKEFSSKSWTGIERFSLSRRPALSRLKRNGGLRQFRQIGRKLGTDGPAILSAALHFERRIVCENGIAGALSALSANL